jgi:large subunit ribosomal protein L24
MNRVRHLKKGDLVIVLSGSQKNKTGKVLAVSQSKGLVQVDGVGIVKRHTKPTQANAKGGIVEKNKWMPACKFQVCTDAGKALGRVGFVIGKDGEKERVFSSKRTSKS